ncbi:unnamed protein product [Protopolystoma xenopodis]|uniref:Uncharacterized protein n=1 Tax=Protopolystoma xenopodis TaxID=117903 RepID=A0A448WV96_9PLAT|nr:unnamed protein product [Protopolystoma xenopodis]
MIHSLDRLHDRPVLCIVFNPVLQVVVSADPSGMLECWGGPRHNYELPTGCFRWKYKSDSDLYCLFALKTHAVSLAVSPNGKLLACLCEDRKVRVLRFVTMKLMVVYDESLQQYSEMQSNKQILPSMEFGRRLAQEKELDRLDAKYLVNLGKCHLSTWLHAYTFLRFFIERWSNMCTRE